MAVYAGVVTGVRSEVLSINNWTVIGLVWAAILLTVYSGIEYVLAAVRLVRTL